MDALASTPPSPVHRVDCGAGVVDAALAARLQVRHPDASSAAIRRSIDVAADAFAGATVVAFLPILIERAASRVLSARAACPPARTELPTGGAP